MTEEAKAAFDRLRKQGLPYRWYEALDERVGREIGEAFRRTVLRDWGVIPKAYAETVTAQPVNLLTQKEVVSIGILGEMLQEPSETKRRVFDYRKTIPESPKELDSLLLYALHHPEMKYTLVLGGEGKSLPAGRRGVGGVNQLIDSLNRHSQKQYQRPIPGNFKIAAVQSENLIPEIQQLLSPEAFADKNLPVGLVTEDAVFAEMGYRKNLIRVYGFQETARQNAAVLITAQRLSRAVPESIFFLPQTIDQLDPAHQWDDLVRALEARQAVLTAA